MALHWSRVGTETAQYLAQMCYFSFRTLAGCGFIAQPCLSFLPGYSVTLGAFGCLLGAFLSSRDDRALGVAPA